MHDDRQMLHYLTYLNQLISGGEEIYCQILPGQASNEAEISTEARPPARPEISWT